MSERRRKSVEEGVREAAIGVVGGSGLYDLPGLSRVEEIGVKTPFGDPSDRYIQGYIGDIRLVFLPRHGRGHVLLPGEINYRANVYGFKALGVRALVSVSAVGSMKKEIAPGDMVIVNQYIDLTKHRAATFFGNGIVGHAQFADPICPALADSLVEACTATRASVHQGGTYLCIEGPHFSTRAESQLYRRWGVDVIGMTNIPEAKLAREAGICYAALAMATDYDCWHEDHEDVSVEGVLTTLANNSEAARAIIAHLPQRVPIARATCACAQAAKDARMTDDQTIGRLIAARKASRTDNDCDVDTPPSISLEEMVDVLWGCEG